MPATRPQAYASATILARRARILSETRRLIAAGGIEGFKLGDVSASAGVAMTTLYNSFGPRESVIAAAIQDCFTDYLAATPNGFPPTSLDHNLERMAITVRFFSAQLNYLRAALALYFSSDATAELRATIDHVARDTNLAVLARIEAAGDLQPGIAIAELADDLVRFELATLGDWAHARIVGDDVLTRLRRGYFALLIAATRGATRASATRRLGRARAGWIDLPATAATSATRRKPMRDVDAPIAPQTRAAGA